MQAIREYVTVKNRQIVLDLPETFDNMDVEVIVLLENISASPDKTSYTENETVTLTAHSNACYDFSGWSGACTGTNPTCTLTMNADKTVTANFSIKKYSLNIATANGSVTKSPSASSYDCGTPVTLSANPNSGYKFVRWEGDATGTNTSASIFMSSNRNVTAIFEAIPASTYTISKTASPEAGGTISASPDKAS